MSDPVLLDISGGIARITFNRPDKLNALDIPTARGFGAAVAAALADPSVRVVLLRGAGKSFMAGGDLSGFRAADDLPGVVRELIGDIHDTLKELAAAPVVTLCAAQGPVAGAGMSFVAGADLAIAAEGASFNVAYGRIGASPDCGGSWALPRLVGMRRAMAMTLLSEVVPAAEALQWGLVNRVVPDAALDAEAETLAQRLANGPAVAQGRIKALIRGALDTTLADQLDAEAESFLACAATEDFSEGIAAFFDRRTPEFTGN